jgi:Protein of unknown function (DUF551)
MTDIHSCSYYCDKPECIKAQRDELREKLEQRKPLTGWQPIETAPRDGTEILMTNGVDVSSGQWFSEYGGTFDRDGAPNCDERDAGWMDWSGGMQPDPTHWMSLPTPPIEDAHGIKE